jgi:hypothetical protein
LGFTNIARVSENTTTIHYLAGPAPRCVFNAVARPVSVHHVSRASVAQIFAVLFDFGTNVWQVTVGTFELGTCLIIRYPVADTVPLGHAQRFFRTPPEGWVCQHEHNPHTTKRHGTKKEVKREKREITGIFVVAVALRLVEFCTIYTTQINSRLHKEVWTKSILKDHNQLEFYSFSTITNVNSGVQR